MLFLEESKQHWCLLVYISHHKDNQTMEVGFSLCVYLTMFYTHFFQRDVFSDDKVRGCYHKARWCQMYYIG